MRITRQALLRIAQDSVAQRVRADRGIIAVYLSGSLLEGEFLLGGATDIDLFIINTSPILTKREIVPLTEDVHLDIAYHAHRDFIQTRNLRVDPWLGPTLNNCKILHDPQHFLDFTQASVRGQFDRADHVLARSQGMLSKARDIWRTFYLQPTVSNPQEFLDYLEAVRCAANSVALLSGPPLTDRRFLLRFPKRAEAIGRSGLYHGLLGLLGAPFLDMAHLDDWMEAWNAAYTAEPAQNPQTANHPARRCYYLHSFEFITASQTPQAVLLPLLQTWATSIQSLSTDAGERQTWEETMHHLQLMGEEFEEKVNALDAYLDQIEETIEEWARKNGARLI
jgi:hypothetical protein